MEDIPEYEVHNTDGQGRKGGAAPMTQYEYMYDKKHKLIENHV